MSSKYLAPYKIPEGLIKLLKDFTREVLRSQPPNIYVFGEQYFRELFEAQGASPNAAVVENITKALADIDTEQTGFVLYDKFRATVSDVQFNLNPREIEVAIIEVDIDNDGRINYSEFAKVAAHALDMAQANGPQRHTQERPRVHIHGMLQDEFESTLARKLEEHEAVGNGVLERPSIRNALMDREVGLTRREVNLIMGHLERKYPDGTFDVNDVAHEAFE
ncbi:MAG: putative radial spoke protein 7, partial [Streblomastix strix]